MNKKSNKWMLVSLLTLASMIFSACGARQTETPVATEPPATEVMSTPTEAMTAEATAEGTMEVTETPGASAGEIDCMGAQQGDEVSMMYQWAGVEETSFNTIMQPLLDACGITLKPESTRDQAMLDTRVNGGTPPDIAFWNVTQLNQYKDMLKPMDELGASKDSYADFFLTPGTVDGKWLGLPVKADVKSIIWYSPSNFEALGYTVPTTWDELNTLVDKMAADGHVPWSMGFEFERRYGVGGFRFHSGYPARSAGSAIRE
ncbi:MAG: ABC transporter substrate-binding protein [Anaerolineales bacterium]